MESFHQTVSRLWRQNKTVSEIAILCRVTAMDVTHALRAMGLL